MQGQRGRPQTQQEAYLLAVRFADLRQRWVLPLQRLIANCVQVHVGEKGKNGAHAFAAVVHLHVCSGWGRCCGAGTQSYLSMTYSRHITVKGERKLSLLPHLMVMFLVSGIGLVAGFALGTWWASPHRQQGRPQTRHEFLMASR